jgi:hypothetical protein
MSEETPITTVKELLDWLKQFDENMELEITSDGSYGAVIPLFQEHIYEKDGKLRIELGY